ncbi:MAG TPA: serine/threonine-protein kinase [Gallionellaceae bacterium]|nr:serine/threonine-protein kinase [Gallionellaceae bacterium]
MAETSAETLPHMIGKYRIVRELGKGATSNVYLVTTPDGAVFALKRLRPDRDTRVSRKMFETEAALCGKLNHPNIVSLIESGVDEDGLPYIIMEHVDGEALDIFSAPNVTLPDEMIIDVVRQTAEALDYACKRGVIHRDLKPANILLQHDNGQVKIADFGCAMISDSQTTQLGVVGTANFMSPEQVQGKPLSYQSDIFSLGGVLYRLLTGRPAFQGTDYQNLASKIIRAPHTPIRELRNDVNDSFVAIVDRALKKRPEERYLSWDEFLYDLHNLSRLIRASEQNTSNTDKFMAMRSSSFFEYFSDVEIKEILPSTTWRTFHDKELLTSEGQRAHSFFVIMAGRAEVTAQGCFLHIATVGECVGESAYLSGGFDLRRERTTALGSVTALELSVAQMRNMSPGCRMRLDQTFLNVLNNKLNAAYDLICHQPQANR